ncbi:outer membrane beta-barrel protein [Microbulbifer elongatus]|uniref:outer membrane beta-barrel protein n=1 Tax=Microbulbifer elongatus TaxID=86173 RepID=UPI001CFE1605|nr:outer membrane beta-barrel protein [Microbulbifer elongatus]
MKRVMQKTLAAAVLLGCTMGAQAAEGGYFGAVAGVMATDIEGDNPFNAGARAGYSWANGFGVEAEYTTSIVDGEFRFSNSWVDVEADYSISTLGAYATYRSQGDLYFKGRLGYLNESVDFGDGADGSDSGLSAGLGMGFSFSEAVNFEAEYTLVEEDVDFWSGTLVFRF